MKYINIYRTNEEGFDRLNFEFELNDGKSYKFNNCKVYASDYNFKFMLIEHNEDPSKLKDSKYLSINKCNGFEVFIKDDNIDFWDMCSLEDELFSNLKILLNHIVPFIYDSIIMKSTNPVELDKEWSLYLSNQYELLKNMSLKSYIDLLVRDESEKSTDDLYFMGVFIFNILSCKQMSHYLVNHPVVKIEL